MTTTPRQRRRQRKLDAILDAAEQLLVQTGLDGLTMANLAAEVDVTAGALYRYFDSKEQLFVQLQVRALDEITALLHERLQSLAGPGKEGAQVLALARLLAANEVHGWFAEQKPARFGLLTMGLSEQRDLVADGGSQQVWQGVAQVLTLVGGLVDEAVQAGAIEDGGDGSSPRRALMLTMGGQGMLQLAKMARHVPGMPPMRALAAELCRSLLLGWGADRDAIAAAQARC